MGKFKRAMSEEVEISSSCTMVDDEEPRTYPQAWLVLFFLVLLRTSVSVFQCTYTVVPTITARVFDVNLSAVNWLANVQGLVYVVLSCVTGWIFEKLGVKRTLIVAGLLNTLGAGLRFVAVKLSTPSFALTLVAQVIGSMAAPLSLNIMTKFTSTWFTENKRATAGVFVASNYGGILAMFMIPNVVTDESRLSLMSLIILLIAVAATVPLIFLPSKPPRPPVQQHILDQTDGISFFKGLAMLAKNYHFWMVLLIHGINIGVSIGFGTVFVQVLTPHGYTDAQAGIINAVGYFAGTLGCTVAGPVLDMTRQHKLFLKLVSPMVFVTYLGFMFILQPNAMAAILFVISMNQFFLAFLIPVVIELGSEVSYPAPDSISNSLVWQACQIFGFIAVLIMDSLRDVKGHMFNALIFQTSFIGVMVLLCFFFRGPMARSAAIAGQPPSDSRSKRTSCTQYEKSVIE
ncbi:major facilitator superfamily domain-containing protein [Gongronella butleri]|nr:major facilitator superfamily domain-containing protein [Gongronella butleri]